MRHERRLRRGRRRPVAALPPAGTATRRLGLALAVGLAIAACTTAREDLPSEPDPYEANRSSLIPEAPTPSPTVTPTPLPDEGPLPAEPGSGGDGVVSGTCGEPAPPPISRFNVKVLSRQPAHVVLDSTPLVGPDAAYCAEIGYTDGRSFCPVRPPGHPERGACEALRVGQAEDTGRTGPTWSVDGRPCRGPEARGSCLNHPDNQYFVFAYGAGRFRACAAGGACGQHTLP